MTDVTFALAIPHTPWIEARVLSFWRLARSLGVSASREGVGSLEYRVANAHAVRVFADREPNHVWAQKLWRWAAQTGATHLLQLQDDVEVCPNFWPRIHAMVSANPDNIIGLETAHPEAPALAKAGHRWHRTNSWLVGVGYVFPVARLKEFLVWCDAHPVTVSRHNEDEIINVWVSSPGGPNEVWHPIPTLIDHDTSIQSTYGNDGHMWRRPTVTWRHESWMAKESEQNSPELARDVFWRQSLPNAPMLPNPYKQLTSDERAKTRKAYYKRFAEETPIASLMVATPHRGHVSAAYAASIVSLAYSPFANAALLEMSDYRMWDADVVRVRNRIVQYFLEQRDETHLLFVDADIEFSPTCVLGMLGANRGFIAAPYPKRAGIDWKAVALGFQQGDPSPAEARAYKYNVLGYDADKVDPESGTCEVDGVGFGLVLLRRAELQAFYDDCFELDQYVDEPWQMRPRRAPIANMFGLRRHLEDGGLLSEDYSFCQRWRGVGLPTERKIHLYLGNGSPASHWGEMRYGGQLEAFGLRRELK